MATGCFARSLRQQMRYMFASAGSTAFVHPTGRTPRLHRCTKIGRTRAKSAPNCAEVDVPGISIAGVVGGVVGCLFAIAGAVILCKTWRALGVKRGDRNRSDVILGGGKAQWLSYLCRQMVARTGFAGLCCFVQARPPSLVQPPPPPPPP